MKALILIAALIIGPIVMVTGVHSIWYDDPSMADLAIVIFVPLTMALVIGWCMKDET